VPDVTSPDLAGPVLQRLRAARPGRLHVIDPYKVPLAEAVEKAARLQDLGFPLLLVGSTDYHDFDRHVPAYVAALKEGVDLPVVLHFPPRRGIGFPVALEADAVLFTAVLNSAATYYVWKSYLDTLNTLNVRGVRPDRHPEWIFTGGMTFRADPVSDRAVAARPVRETIPALDELATVVRAMAYDVVYLYSRCERVTLEVCRHFRAKAAPGQLLIASGGVRTRQEVEAYHAAGADYVVFGGALETPEWRDVLGGMV
jgi:heptaprenylglyceryl phosphate synthase